MTQSTQPGWRNGAWLAGLAAVALLALVTTWSAALARVPQQRAAVERLLRAQTGLDVSYGRLVVRLGFYGPEAEFSDIEMHRPGADAPLLRAPRMVARFESWRLLRGGQLRPGRVLVSGAEIDLRQLATLRRGAPPSVPAVAPRGAVPPADPRAAAVTLLERLESRLPELLAGIPEGSLDFEAVTLVWDDESRPSEPLLLRAPRLYASRRADGAQLSGTLLLPSRLGRTLFVVAQLHGAAPGARGGGADRALPGTHGSAGLDGRLRLSGRGLVLSSWRELGWLPRVVAGGSGDLSLAVQLRDGRVQQAEGELRFAGLGLVAPAPLVARRFRLAAAQFQFARTPTALRYQLRQVELVPIGADAVALGERGALEVLVDPRSGVGTLRAQRLPVEAGALLLRLAKSGSDQVAAFAPSLRVTGGELRQLEAHWGAGGAAASPTLRATLADLQVASGDGAWRVAGLGATLAAEGSRLQIDLDGTDLPLRTPWFAALADDARGTLAGRIDVVTAPGGWSLAAPALQLEVADGPALRLAGSAGAIDGGASTSAWQVALVAPLPRARMALLQAALVRWAPPSFWTAFTDGRVETASAELVDGQWRGGALRLRGASFAAVAADWPATEALDADLTWDGERIDGRLLVARLGELRLDGGRVSTLRAPRDAEVAQLSIEAQLTGPLQAALRLAAAGAGPGMPVLALAGEARLDARLRWPASAAAGNALEVVIDVDGARWQPLAEAAPLTDLHGRLRADARGLRDGQLEGRWLDGPVLLRLAEATPSRLQLVASGRLPATALEREWAWIGLVDRARDGELAWTAELRRDSDDDDAAAEAVAGRARAPRGGAARTSRRGRPTAAAEAPAWRLSVALPGSARAELRWQPGADGAAPWRIDRGTVTLGDGATVAGIPGAVVVGGTLERLELAGLAGAVARFGGSSGWQRPLVGEVAVEDLRLGETTLGNARLRLAGSRESTAVDLAGEAFAGELRQVHAEPGSLQGRFARLRLADATPLPSLATALLSMRTRLALQVTDLQRAGRSLGAFEGTFEADGDSLSLRDLTLRRGARRALASGRCERTTLACTVEVRVAEADLGELLQDLGSSRVLRGSNATLTAKLGWSMQPGVDFARSLQGELDFSARLENGTEPAPAAARADDPPRTDARAWRLLAPLLAVSSRQAADLQAAALAAAANGPETARPVAAVAVAPSLPAFDALELRLAIRDGIGEIERYEASGREARLSVAGQFDFGRDTLEQQARWYWIAPGVAGAVERLDPRSPLAATLRTLRELVAGRGTPNAAATGGTAGGGAPERFALSGAVAAPQVERLPLLDSLP